jgi:hypothetical protein
MTETDCCAAKSVRIEPFFDLTDRRSKIGDRCRRHTTLRRRSRVLDTAMVNAVIAVCLLTRRRLVFRLVQKYKCGDARSDELAR